MLLDRSPLDPKIPFDLHTLGTPLAFVLSQDQTLHVKVFLEEEPLERTCPYPIIRPDDGPPHREGNE